MSTLAEFITGTVNESLKKLLQPVGLIPAAIFVLLNLAFVYPTARAHQIEPAKAFAELKAPTQVAVAALVTFILGYFLLSASSTILDILGGGLIRGSATHSILVWSQRRRRTRLRELDDKRQWHLSRRFFVSEDDRDPLPTALGNVIVATQGSVRKRYGIDMATLWSQLVATPELNDLPAKTIVQDERAARDTLANIAFVIWSFGVEALVFFYLRNDPRHAALALVAIPAGYAVYRFAVARAEAWGDAVETLHDLHRDKLHAALRLAKYGSWSEERRIWERASAFLVGDPDVVADDVFHRDETPSVTAIPAGELTVPDPVTTVRDGPGGQVTEWLKWIDYVVLVARRPARSWPAALAGASAEVLVKDPRVARIGATPTVQGSATPSVTIVGGSGDQAQLLWQLSGLAPGGAVSLRYSLPLYEVDLAGGTFEHVRGVGFKITGAGASVTVTSFAPRGARPEVRLGNTPINPRVADNVYTWDVPKGQPLWLVLPNLK